METKMKPAWLAAVRSRRDAREAWLDACADGFADQPVTVDLARHWTALVHPWEGAWRVTTFDADLVPVSHTTRPTHREALRFAVVELSGDERTVRSVAEGT